MGEHTMIKDMCRGITQKELLLARSRILSGYEEFALEALGTHMTIEDLKSLLDIDESTVIKNYNKNHGDDGKFSSGPGGSLSSGPKPGVGDSVDISGKSKSNNKNKYINMTPHQYVEAVQKDYGSQASWTKEQGIEIGDYTDSSFQYTNTILRNGEKLDDYRKITVKTLDASMKNKLKDDTNLFRGLASDKDFHTGQIIKDKAYSSSSFFEHKGISFATMEAEYQNKTPYVLNINAKKGQKGIITQLVKPKSGLAATEAEYILPRNSKFLIKERIELPEYIQLNVEIL